MPALREKSKMQTAYLEMLLLKKLNGYNKQEPNMITLLTPSDPEQRGSQLSVRFSKSVLSVHKELEKRGIVVSLLS
jgi:kynureninase